jgi:hypothetical protein
VSTTNNGQTPTDDSAILSLKEVEKSLELLKTTLRRRGLDPKSWVTELVRQIAEVKRDIEENRPTLATTRQVYCRVLFARLVADLLKHCARLDESESLRELTYPGPNKGSGSSNKRHVRPSKAFSNALAALSTI